MEIGKGRAVYIDRWRLRNQLQCLWRLKIPKVHRGTNWRPRRADGVSSFLKASRLKTQGNPCFSRRPKAREKPSSQLRLSDRRRVSFFVLFRPSTDALRSMHSRESHLLPSPPPPPIQRWRSLIQKCPQGHTQRNV